MSVKSTLICSKDLNQVQQWINILMDSYREHPSKGLAKVIGYYLQRLISHDEFNFHSYRCEDYSSQLRYWKWLAT